MKNIINKKWFNTGYAFVLNAIIMVIALLCFETYYEMTDDAIISQHLTDGFYSVAFMSYFITRFIGFVQSIIYPLNAYTIVFLCSAYFATCTITKIFIEKFDYKKATFITLFINGFFAVNYYLTISFTRLPGLIGVAGFLAIIHYTSQKRWVLGTVWGIILVILSSFYRFNIFELCFGMAVAFVGALSFNDFFGIEKTKRKLIDLLKIIFEPKRLISALLVLVVAFSLNTVSRNITNSSDEFLAYRQYTSARSKIFDYYVPPYEVAKEEYDSIGIDQNDLDMMRYGFYDADGGYSVEKLREINEIQKKYSSTNIVLTIKTMVWQEMSNLLHLSIEGISLIAVGLVFLLYFIFQNKNKYFSIFIMLAAFAAMYLYFWILGRVVFRVLFSVLFGFACYVLYLYDFQKLKAIEKSSKKQKAIKIISIICSVVIFAGVLFTTNHKNEHIGEGEYPDNGKQITTYLEKNNDKFYEMLCGEVRFWSISNTARNVYTTEHLSYNLNYTESAGTYYRSPYYNYQLSQYGIENYFDNLLNDNVYFIVGNDEKHIINAEMMQKYLQKYYSNGKIVNMRTETVLDDYTVVKYSLSDKGENDDTI